MKPPILIVDDEAANLFLLESLLESRFTVFKATNGAQMWEIIDEAAPLVILLDVMLPDKDGFQLASELRADSKYRHTNIIFLSAKTDTSDVVEGFEHGGFDYIKKPFDPDELLARIQSAIKSARERRHLENNAFTDPLTGLYNRRYLNECIKGETDKARRKKCTFTVAIVDLDKFKRINDELGHPCGDYVLKEFAAAIRSSLRDYDLAVRFGGEEFLIVFPSETKADALAALERIRARIGDTDFRFEEHTIRFTFSAGVAEFGEIEAGPMAFEDLIGKADKRLYYAKQNGRNRIISDDL